MIALFLDGLICGVKGDCGFNVKNVKIEMLSVSAVAVAVAADVAADVDVVVVVDSLTSSVC